MESLTTAKLTTTRDLTYTYVKTDPTQEGKPWILFLHGFPSSVFHYRHQISHFSKAGYGIIAPTLLGYGNTSKPIDYNVYSGKGMSQDVKEILEYEKIGSVIGVGHDWGAYLLSRMANYHPSLFSKFVFLDIGYSNPNFNLNRQTINFVNSMVQQNMGYSVFGYFLFFDEEDAPELMNKNLPSAESLFHAQDEEVIKNYMGAEGGARKWFEEAKVADYPSYLTEEDKAEFKKDFSPEKGGFTAALNWYRAQLHDVNAEDDKAIPEENKSLKSPTLLISTSNLITAAADFPSQMKQSAPDLELKKLDAGHWVMMEKPEETNQLMAEFFEK